jgi:hypothetical protein
MNPSGSTPEAGLVLVAVGLTALVAVVGWIVALVLWRRRGKLEAELMLIRRRAQAPCLAPSEAVFSFLYTTPGQGPIQACAVTSGRLLSRFRNEVDKKTEAGADILLVVENRGEDPRECRLLLDGQSVPLAQEPAVSDAHGLLYIHYPYQPDRHGQDQRLVIEFETTNGVQDRHTYLLKHGVRSLRRADPP